MICLPRPHAESIKGKVFQMEGLVCCHPPRDDHIYILPCSGHLNRHGEHAKWLMSSHMRWAQHKIFNILYLILGCIYCCSELSVTCGRWLCPLRIQNSRARHIQHCASADMAWNVHRFKHLRYCMSNRFHPYKSPMLRFKREPSCAREQILDLGVLELRKFT